MENITHPAFSHNEMTERARLRRARMVGNFASSYQEADDWDLDFWQSAGAEARLSALVNLRKEVEIVRLAKEAADGHR